MSKKSGKYWVLSLILCWHAYCIKTEQTQQTKDRKMITANTPLGVIATEYSGATRILRAHGLDFCCGGSKTVAQACGDNTDKLLAELQGLEKFEGDDDWKVRPLNELIEHILKNYHAKHREDLPEIIRLARRVEQVHGYHPECPAGLADILEKLQEDLLSHMEKEEQVLFPAINESADKDWISNPIKVMLHEHDEAGRDVERMDQITNNFTLPGDACNTWRALYMNTRTFIAELMEHISLENNILFPRAVGE